MAPTLRCLSSCPCICTLQFCLTTSQFRECHTVNPHHRLPSFTALFTEMQTQQQWGLYVQVGRAAAPGGNLLLPRKGSTKSSLATGSAEMIRVQHAGVGSGVRHAREGIPHNAAKQMKEGSVGIEANAQEARGGVAGGHNTPATGQGAGGGCTRGRVGRGMGRLR